MKSSVFKPGNYNSYFAPAKPAYIWDACIVYFREESRMQRVGVLTF